EMFGGKHLPDEKNLLDALQVHLREQIKIGDVHHDRGDPENEVDRILDEKIHQLDWKGGGLVRDNHPGCPFRNAQAKLERVRVKINWRQAAHHFAPIQLQTLESPIDKINGAAVIQRHALGNASRAGSMNQAIRIGVDDCFQPFEQHGLVIKRLGGHRLLDQQQAIGWDVQRAQGIGILRGRNNDVRVEVLQHAFETLRRRFDIQVGVGVATVKDAEIGNDVL